MTAPTPEKCRNQIVDARDKVEVTAHDMLEALRLYFYGENGAGGFFDTWKQEIERRVQAAVDAESGPPQPSALDELEEWILFEIEGELDGGPGTPNAGVMKNWEHMLALVRRARVEG